MSQSLPLHVQQTLSGLDSYGGVVGVGGKSMGIIVGVCSLMATGAENCTFVVSLAADGHVLNLSE